MSTIITNIVCGAFMLTAQMNIEKHVNREYGTKCIRCGDKNTRCEQLLVFPPLQCEYPVISTHTNVTTNVVWTVQTMEKK